MEWCNRSRVWREAAPAAELRVIHCVAPRTSKTTTDHMPWFGFTHEMNPGIQDALRALQITNQSIANNCEICFRSALLIQTKLLAEQPRKVPNDRAELSELLAR